MIRLVSAILLLVATGLAVGAVAFGPIFSTPRSQLVVQEIEIDLGEKPINASLFVPVRIANRGSATGSVLSLENSCLRAGCFRSASQEKSPVEPGQEIEFLIELELHQTGPFTIPIQLFLDDNGVRPVQLYLRGICMPERGKPDASSGS